MLGGLATANVQVIWALPHLPGLLIIALIVALPTLASFVIGARLSTRHADVLSAILAVLAASSLFLLDTLVPEITVLAWPLAYFGALALAIAGGIYARHRRPREPRRPSGYTEPTDP